MSRLYDEAKTKVWTIEVSVRNSSVLGELGGWPKSGTPTMQA